MHYHLDLGARLAPLRRQGVLILASGNVVHNLRRIDWSDPDGGADWAHRFDDAVADRMRVGPGDILKTLDHPDFDLAVPTNDHFIPMLYVAALAAAAGREAEAFLRGYAMGSLSMTCYGIGMENLPCREGEGAALLPEGVPGDQTNG